MPISKRVSSQRASMLRTTRSTLTTFDSDTLTAICSHPAATNIAPFLTLEEPYAHLLEMYLDDELVAVAAFDQLEHGLSAIYTFFKVDDALEKRSLGTFAILKLIELCQEKRLPHLYLGYWIEECRKMRYKQAFFAYRAARWSPLAPP